MPGNQRSPSPFMSRVDGRRKTREAEQEAALIDAEAQDVVEGRKQPGIAKIGFQDRRFDWEHKL